MSVFSFNIFEELFYFRLLSLNTSHIYSDDTPTGLKVLLL